MTQKLNWPNTLFLIAVPLVGMLGTLYCALTGQIAWQTWVFTLLLTAAMGLSITAGYHRLFAHKSYQAAWPVRLFFALFGAGAFEGSVLEWSTDHRNHHRYTDTDKDPYNIQRGFWFAHIGWLFFLDVSQRDFSNVSDLAADKLLRWQHRFYIPVAFCVGFLLPTLVAGLWGDWLGGFIVAGALRITFSHHTTFFINSICHLWGKRTFSDKQSARDNWVTAILTFGEGYHNFHHQFPIDYRNGVRFYHFDPTKWTIKLMQWCGLAQDLKTVSDRIIFRYKLEADQKRLVPEWQLQTKVQRLQEGIMQLLHRIEELEQEYRALKKQKVASYRQALLTQRLRLKAARRELRASLSQWALLLEAAA